MNTVVLTGETGYLGRQILKSLLQDYHVIGLSRHSSSQCIDDYYNSNGVYVPLQTNLEDCAPHRILDLIQSHERNLGSTVTGLVNNAIFGFPPQPSSISKLDVSRAAEGIFAVHIRLSIAFSDLMIQRNASASVINVSSMYGKVAPQPSNYCDNTSINPLLYGCMKAALIQGTKYLSAVYASRNIRFNSVSFGPFPSTQVQSNHPDFINKLASCTHLGRVAQAHESPGVIKFLLSNSSSFMTGADISVDGGWTSW